MDHIAELVLEAKADVGEGPCWDEQNQVLYWIDITQKHIHRYTPITGSSETFMMDQPIGAVALTTDETLLCAMENGFYLYNLTDNLSTFLHDPEADRSDNRFNDGKCDAGGRFWAGTMSQTGKEKAGSLYCFHPDGRCERKLQKISISNGLSWSLDQRTLYYIDSPTREVVAYDIDLSTGGLGDSRVAIRFSAEDGLPDGMTIDKEGNLWIAMWGGSCVLRYDPKSGRLLERVKLPVSQVTSCTFGGSALDELYITTARIGLTEEQLKQEPLAGGLFRFKTGSKGFPVARYHLQTNKQ
jgi:sugar lactone lactonase YvrE